MRTRTPAAIAAILFALLESHAHAQILGEPVELPLQDPNWKTLFDGKSLTGWVTKGGHYDGNAAWTVEDGALTGRVGAAGEGGLIYTAEPYSAFDFSCDVRMDFPFDSGIFVRMAPEGRGAQVTLDHRSDGEIAAIYSDGFLAHNPIAKDKFKKDEWNHVDVRCTGFDMHLKVWLNGEQVMDHQIPDGSPGFAPRGLIGLQVHGDRDDPKSNKVQFKNIRVRELGIFHDVGFVNAKDGLLTIPPEASEKGWRSLTSGRDLYSNWAVAFGEISYRIPGDEHKLENGVLFMPAKGTGQIESKEDFADFRLRVDFKIARMANSGLYLRSARTPDNPSFTGCEVQILDDFNWERETKTTLLPYQFTGGLYGSVAAGWKRYRPIGEWNCYEVLFIGHRLAVALNGLTLYDVDVTKVPVGDHPPFAERLSKGFIGFQQYGAPGVTGPYSAWFRNIFVQTL